MSAEQLLAERGVFKGHDGLRGLASAQEFWDKRPYGTRLYYGPGGLDYLHRGVLHAAIEALDAVSDVSKMSDETLMRLRAAIGDELERRYIKSKRAQAEEAARLRSGSSADHSLPEKQQ